MKTSPETNEEDDQDFPLTPAVTTYRHSIFFHITGTKNTKKTLLSISQGAKKDEGKTWFLELADKGMSVELSRQLSYFIRNPHRQFITFYPVFIPVRIGRL